MSEMDELLKKSLSGSGSGPELSSEFEARLSRRLRPPGLGSRGRAWLVGYGVLGLVLCLLAMWSMGLPLWVGGASLLVPGIGIGAFGWSYFRR